MFSLRFKNFWKNSDQSKNTFFIPLMESVFQEKAFVVFDPSVRVDLEVESVFSPRLNPVVRKLKRAFESDGEKSISKTESNANRRVWFSGENIRPPIFREYNSYLCFDNESLSKNVHYLPLWVLNFDWFSESQVNGRVREMPQIGEFLKSRKFSSKINYQSKFCCAFIGVAENMRMSIVQELNSINEVEIFGRSVNRVVPDKQEAAKDFKFVMAFENTLYPGYVTEKLVEAYLSNAVPLYWGSDKFQFFNPKAFINLNDCDSIREFVDVVREIDSSDDRYKEVFEQQLFDKEFDLEQLVNNLREDLL